jgi:hypothetical protein
MYDDEMEYFNDRAVTCPRCEGNGGDPYGIEYISGSATQPCCYLCNAYGKVMPHNADTYNSLTEEEKKDFR